MGACQESCTEDHPCGVLGCPATTFTAPPPPPPPPPPPAAASFHPGESSAQAEIHHHQPSTAPMLIDEPIATPTQPSVSGEIPPPSQTDEPNGAQAIPAPPQPNVGEYPPPGHRPYGGEDLRHRRQRGGRKHHRCHDHDDYNYIPVISELGRRRCMQYYPNDHYLNNMPSFLRVPLWPDERESERSPTPPRVGRRRAWWKDDYTLFRRWTSCPIRDEPPPRRDGRQEEDQGPSEGPQTGPRVYDNLRVPPPSSWPPNAWWRNNYMPFRRWTSFPVRDEPPPPPPPPPPPAPPGQDGRQEEDPGPSEGPQTGPRVYDNVVIGDPSKVIIGEGNYGARKTGGRVARNTVIR